MNTLHRLTSTAILTAMLFAMAGCTGMTHREQNTAIGAGAGAIGGAVLTGGRAAGTLGGAAIGGVIGHEVGK